MGSVPPPPGFNRPEEPTCKTNSVAFAERLKIQRRYSPGLAPPISATTYNVAVLRIDFSDSNMTVSTATTETQFSNVRSFYSENSYDLLTVTSTVSKGGSGARGAYRMPRTLSYYASGINSRYGEIFSDAVAIATAAGYNFSSMNHIMIYHAGDGSETSGSPNSLIWSVFDPSISLTLQGKSFSGATFVPEKEASPYDPLGVIVHEYGHQLGLPDLYNTNTGNTTVGRWSLMDSGVYTGPSLAPGSNPSHFDAWCKQFLGFSSPQTISTSQESSTSLTQTEVSRSGTVRIPISVSDIGGSNEYFLLEYRRTEGGSFDNYLPGQGLLIWHIDDSIASNSSRINSNNINIDSSRPGIGLIEADGTDTSNNGDAGDPWPGTSQQTKFQAPTANAYNGKDSGVFVLKISDPGNSAISFKILSTLTNTTITNSTESGAVIVTGGVKGYVNPEEGETALFGIRAISNGTVQIKIYSMNGDLVWETSYSGNQGQQQVVRWNIENLNGTTVSSGIYFIHVSGGGIDSKKKIAIVR